MRNHALDGLRAMAALMIVFYHLGLSGVSANLMERHHGMAGRLLDGLGASGVELFFTLSAVVLLRPYLRHARAMDVWQYLWRRATRLWPAFFGAWLLAGATCALITFHPTWWVSVMPPFTLAGWLAQSFIVYVGYAPYNYAWWTLTVEVLFYVLAPLLVLALARRSAAAMKIVFVASLAVALAIGAVGAPDTVDGMLLKFVSYVSCFCGGLLLAKQDISGRTRLALLVAGLAIVAGDVLGWDVNFRAGYGLIYMAAVSQLLVPGAWAGAALAKPLLVWLGERSYSLFLTHYSVITLACWATSLVVEDKGPVYFAVSRVLALAGSLVVACVLFECVERRFARGLVTAGMWVPDRRARMRIARRERAAV